VEEALQGVKMKYKIQFKATVLAAVSKLFLGTSMVLEHWTYLKSCSNWIAPYWPSKRRE